MQLLIALASVDFIEKQRIAVKMDRLYHLATVTAVKRKYVTVKFDDGDTGEFDKVEDAKLVKALPKGTKRIKTPLTLAELKELMAPTEKVVEKVSEKVTVTQKVKPISIRISKEEIAPSVRPDPKPEPYLAPPIEYKSPVTLRQKLKEFDDRIIHPIDLARGMVVRVPINTELYTVLLLDYDEVTRKWAAVQLKETTKIIQVPTNQLFTHKAPLTPYEKMWAGKYMRRLEETEA